MKIGISIPNNWGVKDVSALLDLAVLAEERGFASVSTSEHLINTSYVRSRIGDGPYYHPLAMLSAIAARTSRIELVTSVVVLPFHNPFDIAKYVATLDHISRGRMILGVGAGNVPEEFAALNIPWKRRGAITDESIEVIRALWSNEVSRHQGEVWSFSDIHTAPKPFRRARVPIWIGGSSPAAIHRAARVGDGWHPTSITPEEFFTTAAQIREAAFSRGRDPSKIEMCMRLNLSLDDQVVTPSEMRSTIKSGDTKGIIDTARSFADAGATHTIFALNSNDPEALQQTVEELARDVLPNF